MLEARGLPVVRQIQLGPTNIVRAALLAGQIDIYPEYTGNGALFFHREAEPAWKDAAAGYAEVKKLDARREPARLARAGAGQQHLGHRDPRRPGGLAGRQMPRRPGDLLGRAGGSSWRPRPSSSKARRHCRPSRKTYGFQLRADQLLTLSGGNTAATLRAAAEGISGVNAAMAYGTDGELAALGLNALCDDKGAQIVYAPAPVVRSRAASNTRRSPRRWPRCSRPTLETLQKLNARIAVAGEDAGAVARD